MKPQISIIIPTWNTANITLKCINTINRFLSPLHPQIIIVDNDSTDNTPEVLGKLKNITYIHNSINLGFSKANNIGVQHAVSDHLLFLNSDMEFTDNSFVKMLEYFKKNPNIGAIGPRFLNPDLSPQGSVFPLQTPLNAIKEYWLGTKNAYSKYVPSTSKPIPVDNISGGAVLISAINFKEIGGWDERYHFYSEDFEFCRQIRRLGKQIYYYPGCTVIHQHGVSGKSLVDADNQWRRQIPSSIIFHGVIEHYIIFFIMWTSQKWAKLFQR